MSRFTQEELLSFALGDADPELRTQIESALSNNSTLQGELDELRNWVKVIRTFPFGTNNRVKSDRKQIWRIALASVTLLLAGFMLGRLPTERDSRSASELVRTNPTQETPGSTPSGYALNNFSSGIM